MKALLLTLGHNSSAVMVDGGAVAWGYETERLTRVKSDSRFPMHHIDAMIPDLRPDIVYVSHWSPTGRLADMSAKHWDMSRFEEVPVRSLSPDFTHHDAHMWSALAYAGPKFPYGLRTYVLVVDGFGSYGEHLSLYQVERYREPMLLRRFHGYGTSLGLWYQYATAFMGMKMHEDEYKLLGYEVHAPSELVPKLLALADKKSDQWLMNLSKSVLYDKLDPLYRIDALAGVKNRIFGHLLEICHKFDITDSSDHAARTILSFYVQRVLEFTLLKFLAPYYITNLIVAGGVFYNVRMNKVLSERVDGKFCAMPLAGDQGAALGLYAADHPYFEVPDDLCWGRRTLTDPGQVRDMTFALSEADAVSVIIDRLKTDGVVNLVRGDMEFGPRALCNTSTLALPTMDNVRRINAANNRNTVMPMAPVVNELAYKTLFEHTEKIWRSQRHMIVAMELKEYPLPEVQGVTHEYTWPHHHHSGRPQVIDSSDHLMSQILIHFGGVLINTSFNFHGVPICFDLKSVVNNHLLQSFHTVVIKNVKT